jgi:uncharacterized protein (DUF1499 family)
MLTFRIVRGNCIMRWILGIGVLFLAVTTFLLWKNLRVPETTGLTTQGRLHPCLPSPNCVCCCHNDPTHYIAPLSYTSDESLNQIQAFLSAHYTTQVIQRTPDYLHVVVTTPLMHYKDDLEFAVDRQKKTIRVRSASRIGYSDGGINRARIEALRTFLNTEPNPAIR